MKMLWALVLNTHRSYSTNTIAIGNNAIAGNTDTSRTSYDAEDLVVAIEVASQSTSGFDSNWWCEFGYRD